MDKSIKVLQVNSGSKTYGGGSAILYEIYKNIDKNKVQFDFLTPEITTYEFRREEIESMGGRIFELKVSVNSMKTKFLLTKRLYSFLKENKYDVIHINSGKFFFILQVALVSKIAKNKKIIIHVHNPVNNNKFFRQILINICKPLIKLVATDYFACSMLAAKSMFTRSVISSSKFKIIKNGIEVEKFKFDNDIRREYRKQLNIEDKLVICNIGRFVEQKNHRFLIDIFQEVYKQDKNVILLLIGEGPLEEDTKEQVEQLGLDKNVLFLGLRDDIANILQSVDCFVLPSLYEGFGIVGVEAQATGLPCFVSANLPEELKVTDNIEYISLEENPEIWANKIIEKKIDYDRTNCYKLVKDKGYDIKEVSKNLEEFYYNY